MKPLIRAISALLLLSMLASFVAACGGDDDDDDPTATSATGAATATTGAATATTGAATATTGASPETDASPTAESTGELTEVTVGFIPVLIYGPLMLAQDKGYFEQHGLDVQFENLPGGSDMVVLTANGDFDIGVGGAGPAYFNAVERGLDLKIIAPLHFERDPQATPLMVSKERFDSGELTSAGDLEGLKVSVNARGATEYWLDTALRTDGLTIEDIDLQQLPFPDVPAALESGALDGGMLGEPVATLAEQQGIAVRLDVDFPADFQPTFVWVNPDFAADEPDLVTGFAAGMMQGCRDLWADDWDSDENLAIINGYTNVDAALIREASRTWCEPNGTINVDDLATLQEFFGDRGLLEYDDLLDIESLIDRSYVEAALKEIGESDLK
jgi:NitT/TauT family transport system substrate-binding protein